MNKKEEKLLNDICSKCFKHYKKCLMNEPYIGLCAVKDMDELLVFIRRKS